MRAGEGMFGMGPDEQDSQKEEGSQRGGMEIVAEQRRRGTVEAHRGISIL